MKENIFDEVDNLKAKVEEKILTNQELLKLIAINHDNPLSKPDIVGVGNLVDKHIFFKPRIFDQTVTQTSCFLVMDMVISTLRNRDSFAEIRFIFKILTHNSLVELYDGKTRAYQICRRLYDCFANEKGSWIGKSSFEYCNSIEAPTDYQALQLVFSVTDFKGSK